MVVKKNTKTKEEKINRYIIQTKSTKGSTIFVFFFLLIAGSCLYLFTDFMIFRYLGAKICVIWLKIFGLHQANVSIIGSHVFVNPLGIHGQRSVRFIQDCTPSGWILPSLCFLSVPYTTLKKRLLIYSLLVIISYFIFECINGTEIYLYAQGLEYDAVHNARLTISTISIRINEIIIAVYIIVQYAIVLKVWPEFGIPFVYLTIPKKNEIIKSI